MDSFQGILFFIASIIIFLFGMAELSSTVQKLMTVSVRGYIRYAVRRPVNGILTGVIMTFLLQSSTATSIITIGMVGAGLITFFNSLGIILGADIGTTFTVQLVVWKINKLSPLFIVAGGVMWISTHGKLRKTGQAVFYFGVMFFGLTLAADLATPLRSSDIWLRHLGDLRNPALGFIVGFVITAVVHSSSMTISLLAVLAQQGLIDIGTAMPVVLGANIGTTATAILASTVSGRSGKRSASAHFVFKTVGVVAGFFILPEFNSFILKLSHDPAQQIAYGHFLLNVGIVAAFTPVLKPFSKLIEKVLPGSEDIMPVWPEFLDNTSLADPGRALECVRKELRREMLLAGRMVEEAMSLLTEYMESKRRNIMYLELVVDNLRTSIIDYLRQVSCIDLNPELPGKLFAYTAIAEDIERIADHCTNLADLARNKMKMSIKFSSKANSELEDIRSLVLENMADTDLLLDNGGKREILAIGDREARIDLAISDARDNHLERFHRRMCQAEAGPVFIEMLINLERISDHCQNIAEYVEGIQTGKTYIRYTGPVTTI